MNSLQIYQVLEKIVSKIKCQFDVIPCDLLRSYKIEKYPVLLCVNNQPASEAGEHWLGIFISRLHGEVEFYDSFGFGMEFYPKDFINFAIKLNSRVLENTVAVQGPLSNACGHFVIFFFV